MAIVKDVTLKNVLTSITNGAADLLSSSDFISRTIGMNNSYEDLMFIVQSLGREPISLLGKDYPFIYDHVRRNYMQGRYVDSMEYDGCYKFTFYKEVPTVRFANPYNDPMNLLDKWTPNATFETTSIYNDGGRTSIHYSESDDGRTNNRKIAYQGDLDNGNPGTSTNSIYSYGPVVTTCDLIKKTNDNFNHGKYETLVARFHTNAETSKSSANPTQTAISKTYGMSHGRNLLKWNKTVHNGYDNPYCRVWTYHHQYNQIARQIRPFSEVSTQEDLESMELTGNYNTVGFRTSESSNLDAVDGFEGGSKRLDKYGVLNYRNGTVNIAPTAKIVDYFGGHENEYDKQIIATKKCMFSIENLAWKDDKMRKDEFDAYGLSPEQKGPLGGRIMWFPPYDLSFSEDVSVDWNPNKFIGRGENVYTYTNTERKGNLTFTLLIDHPAILDYWTGHEKNGMKNQGLHLDPGNSGGVDNKNNQENTLLRFFAGCDILSAKPQEYKVHLVKPEVVPEPPEPEEPTPTEPDEVKVTVRKAICALLYYPNNYSGKDDASNKDNNNTKKVNPIYYLMNGVGAQRYVNPTTKKDEDIPTVIDVKPTGLLDGVSGYEVQTGAMFGGISQAIAELNPDYEVIKSTYADLETGEKKGQYLTGPGGNKIKVSYGSNSYTLAKIVGSKAMSLGNAKGNETGGVSKNVTGPNHLWYRKRYYYRVDKAYENQDFSNPMSYIDAKSFGFNGDAFDIRQMSDESSGYEFKRYFELKDDSDTYKLISFTDLFVAMEGDANNVVKPYSKDNVELVRDVFKNKDKYSNIKISFNGHASYQGYAKFNNDLAYNRALTIKKWLGGFKELDGVEMGEPKTINQQKETKTNTGHLDDRAVKIWRSASVTIEYEEETILDAATAESPKVATDGNGNTKTDKDGKTPLVTERVEPKNIKTVDYTTNENGEKVPVKEARGTDDSSVSGERNVMSLAQGQPFTYPGPDISKVNDVYMKNRSGMDMNVRGAAPIGIVTSPNVDELMSAKFKMREPNPDTFTRKSIVKRYDNEGEFFEALTEEAPFLHHLISEKIRYFDPAYHAISPEGFNARLTFLHQCTRQGSTLEHSAFDASTAYNLAFGRPPVCVLRLGDFYYTKIIITSLNIQYDNAQWDMNPEGIGMMPMFAKISLNFVFLGGSDLAGPIARLQNAVSFNYYANTSVYDNRAEKVEYDPNGSGREIKFRGFRYPNDASGNRLDMNRIGEEDENGRIYAEDF